MTFDRRVRVLIADADPGIRRDLNQRLLDAEVFADTAADGKDAIDRLRETNYAVVVLDLQLQQVSSERVLDFIAALPREQRPVVLVLARTSARSLDVDAVQIVLRKPCDIQQLADIVHSCVRNAAYSVRRDELSGELGASSAAQLA